MILVLEINGELLHLFSSIAEVESHLEAIDIENGEYEFCDHTGQRIVGELTAPITTSRPGGFHLRFEGIPDKSILNSFISRARSLERGCEEFKTLNDLKRIIKN